MDTIENTTTNTVESLELEDYPKVVPFEAFKWFLGVHFSISLFLESAFKAFEDKEQGVHVFERAEPSKFTRVWMKGAMSV